MYLAGFAFLTNPFKSKFTFEISIHYNPQNVVKKFNDLDEDDVKWAKIKENFHIVLTV